MSSLFYIDGLAKVIIFLIIFIGLVVALFAKQYLKGDSRYNLFFFTLPLIIISVIITVSSDNIFLFLTSWSLSNTILVVMMIHKSNWKSAFASGKLAAKNFLIGLCFLSLGLVLLSHQTGQTSIQSILAFEYEDQIQPIIALLLILFAAMTQSAIYPFNSWLTSSLNSPTPVSALMHAGLVNGGGILLARFAPLYFNSPKILTLIFVIGITTALVGTFWKLIQSNVKSMLACSTIGQMGFMLAQCGLGLFPAAIAHLFWHGCFKSYLFLTSGAAAQEKKFDLSYPPSFASFVSALICGIFGILSFSAIANKNLLLANSNSVLFTAAFIAATHLALNVLREKPVINLPIAIILTSVAGILYGGSIRIIESQFSTSELHNPQTLNAFHLLAIFIFISLWLGRLFIHNPKQKMSHLMTKFYVKALNASQPASSTITANRNQYKL
ncbi:MAG: proton-conducting membrane transporter [Proteobacteria bacterium]|nr:proton-conducting membrane transporter [Pseudomonadota bacterium]